jgi:hypothetical protein
MPIPVPDMLFLSDDALEWGFLGVSLATMGIGLAGVRPQQVVEITASAGARSAGSESNKLSSGGAEAEISGG